MTAKEYKHLKGLKKENLRDNMTDTESALTTLAEVATREISQNEDPETIAHSINIARRGGGVAKVAREALNIFTWLDNDNNNRPKQIKSRN